MHGTWIDGYDSQNKDKNITITKNKSMLLFRAVYYSKKHVIPHPVIAAILNVILNILQCWKQQWNACQIFQKQPKTIINSY